MIAADDERARLLRRLTELNSGDSLIADAYASAPLIRLREVVDSLEGARRDIARLGHLWAVWADDSKPSSRVG